jgi:hypothetical protein
MASVKKVSTLDRAGLIAVCDHLLGDGRERFLLSATGRMYVGQLTRAVEALVRPAGAPVATDPETEALRAHSERGSAVWYALSAVAACPDFDDETRAAATRVLSLFPAKPAARATVAERVEQAAAVRAALPGLAGDLARLPSAPGGGSFEGWIRRWCDAGSDFADTLIHVAMGGEPAPVSRRSRGSEMGAVSGLIVRARATLRDEMAYDATLPATLDAELFGLYDQLLEARRERAEAEARRAEPATPTA